MLSGSGSLFSPQQVYNELYKQVMRELNEKNNVIVDGTFHKQVPREQVKRMAAEFPIPVASRNF